MATRNSSENSMSRARALKGRSMLCSRKQHSEHDSVASTALCSKQMLAGSWKRMILHWMQGCFSDEVDLLEKVRDLGSDLAVVLLSSVPSVLLLMVAYSVNSKGSGIGSFVVAS